MAEMKLFAPGPALLRGFLADLEKHLEKVISEGHLVTIDGSLELPPVNEDGEFIGTSYYKYEIEICYRSKQEPPAEKEPTP